MLNVVATFLYSPLNLCHLEGTSFALLSLQPISPIYFQDGAFYGVFTGAIHFCKKKGLRFTFFQKSDIDFHLVFE